MFFYSFDKYFWFDKVFFSDLEVKFKPWDLVSLNWWYCLVLWSSIPFIDLYQNYVIDINEIKIVKKWLLSKNSMKLIFYIISTYFSLYKNVIPLYIPLSNDIWKFMQSNFNIKKNMNKDLLNFSSNQIDNYTNYISYQNLYIFSDIWSAYNLVKEKYIIENYDFVSWNSTALYKSKIFWKVKEFKTNIVLATFSQIFFDRKNLKKIHLFFPETWYYKNNKEPRYDTVELVSFMANIYGADLLFHYDYRQFN